jgi:hypothetical protein
METTGIAISELDAELGEYLPAREVMCAWSSSSTRQSNSAGNGNGNTAQAGLINVSALNGNFNGNFNSQSNSAGQSLMHL